MRQMIKRNSAVKNVLPPIIRTGDSPYGQKGHTYRNPVAKIAIRLNFFAIFICSFHIKTAGIMINQRSNAPLTAALAPEPSHTSFLTQIPSGSSIMKWQLKGLQMKIVARKYDNANKMLKTCVPHKTHRSVLVVSKMRW